MKGAIYPLTALVLLALALCVVFAVMRWIGQQQKERAEGAARWEPHVGIGYDGAVVIDVRRVARWGRHERVLGTPTEIARVPNGASTDEALLEARALAVIRAEMYNTMGDAQ